MWCSQEKKKKEKNIFGSEGHRVSVTTAYLCYCHAKQPQMIEKRMCIVVFKRDSIHKNKQQTRFGPGLVFANL